MTYADFSLEDIAIQFKIPNKVIPLFSGTISPMVISERLQQDLALAQELPIKSEKARSEMIVLPILLDIRAKNSKYFTIYSGDHLVADKTKGLTGECDFILAKETGSFSINVPIIAVVEAKRQNMEQGIAQCSAQLIGAKLFNEQKGVEVNKLYGCVTTGELWKFIKLEDNCLWIDRTMYFLNEVAQLLGVWQQIIDEMKLTTHHKMK